jgi:hypothetical protein
MDYILHLFWHLCWLLTTTREERNDTEPNHFNR